MRVINKHTKHHVHFPQIIFRRVTFKDIGGSIASNVFEILSGQMMFVCRLQVQMELIDPVNDAFVNHTHQEVAFIRPISLRNPSDLGSLIKFHVRPILFVAFSVKWKRRSAKFCSSINWAQLYTRGDHKFADLWDNRTPRIELTKRSDFYLMIKSNGVEAYHKLESAKNFNGFLVLTPYLKKGGNREKGV